MSGDVNEILRAYLVTQAGLTALVSDRIYCPRLPEGATLPAVGYFVRGGVSRAFTRSIKSPSFQVDCWGRTPLEARSVYCALYDILQGIGGYYNAEIPVVVGAATYYILAASEEVPGQDIQDVTTPNYYRVLSDFRVKMKVE